MFKSLQQLGLRFQKPKQSSRHPKEEKPEKPDKNFDRIVMVRVQ